MPSGIRERKFIKLPAAKHMHASSIQVGMTILPRILKGCHSEDRA